MIGSSRAHFHDISVGPELHDVQGPPCTAPLILLYLELQAVQDMTCLAPLQEPSYFLKKNCTGPLFLYTFPLLLIVTGVLQQGLLSFNDDLVIPQVRSVFEVHILLEVHVLLSRPAPIKPKKMHITASSHADALLLLITVNKTLSWIASPRNEWGLTVLLWM